MRDPYDTVDELDPDYDDVDPYDAVQNLCALVTDGDQAQHADQLGQVIINALRWHNV